MLFQEKKVKIFEIVVWKGPKKSTSIGILFVYLVKYIEEQSGAGPKWHNAEQLLTYYVNWYMP